MIAHRGVSGLECENTAAAFVAAGNRSYFGIETDTHTTADGKLIVIHDENTKRVSGVDKNVEELPFSEIENVRLFDKEEGVTRRDLTIPTLEEYIRICKRYDKVAVLELKTVSSEEIFRMMVELIKSLGHYEKTVFISFHEKCALIIRKLCPDATVQFLTSEWKDELADFLRENRFDLDIHYRAVTRELVELIHAMGHEINCWTVNDPDVAEALVEMGVDYITTNILE